MNDFQTGAANEIHGLPVPPDLAEEIEQALERLRHVKRVQVARLAQGKEKPPKKYGNTYVIPKRLVYKVTGSY